MNDNVVSSTIDNPLKDKVVLVTGANRGIGKAFVETFVKHGAKKVYASVRSNIESYDPPSEPVNSGTIQPLYLDLTNMDSIIKAGKIASDVEIVINNGGVLSRTSPLDDADDFDGNDGHNNNDTNAITYLQHEMNVNVYGLLRMAQIFIPILRKNATTRGGGEAAKLSSSSSNGSGGCANYFVQINSVASMRCGMYDVATYSASKAAAYSITQAIQQQCNDVALSSEENSGTIQVISVHPGPIATDMINDASEELAKQAEPPENVALEVINAMRNKNNHNANNNKDNSLIVVFPDTKSKSMGELYMYGSRGRDGGGGGGERNSTSNGGTTTTTTGKRKERDDDDDDGGGNNKKKNETSSGFGQTVIVEGKMYG